MPALSELPMISVVHPAYHWRPNGGHGSFCPSGNLRLSWDRVLATVSAGQRPDQKCGIGSRESGEGERAHTHSAGYVMAAEKADGGAVSDLGHELGGRRQHAPISTAPAVEPAMMERRALGPLTAGCASSLGGADDILGAEAWMGGGGDCGGGSCVVGGTTAGLSSFQVRFRPPRNFDCGALRSEAAPRPRAKKLGDDVIFVFA